MERLLMYLVATLTAGLLIIYMFRVVHRRLPTLSEKVETVLLYAGLVMSAVGIMLLLYYVFT